MLVTTMVRHRILSTAFIPGLFASHSAFALDWEIERNFRYFLYPSDVAAQRVGRDLYIVEKGATPTPEQLEILMNGAWCRSRGIMRARAFGQQRGLSLQASCADR